MIKYCYDKWAQNQEELRQAIIYNAREIKHCDYKFLVQLVVDHVLNVGKGYRTWDSKNITVIDNGDYQGTLMFLIPSDSYQPSCDQYLMTYSWYGSCSGCDSLMAAQMDMPWDDEAPLTERNISDIMSLCKDLVANMVKPYSGYGDADDFDVVEF